MTNFLMVAGCGTADALTQSVKKGQSGVKLAWGKQAAALQTKKPA